MVIPDNNLFLLICRRAEAPSIQCLRTLFNPLSFKKLRQLIWYYCPIEKKKNETKLNKTFLKLHSPRIPRSSLKAAGQGSQAGHDSWKKNIGELSPPTGNVNCLLNLPQCCMGRQQAATKKPQSPRFMTAVPDGSFTSLPVHEENRRL